MCSPSSSSSSSSLALDLSWTKVTSLPLNSGFWVKACVCQKVWKRRLGHSLSQMLLLLSLSHSFRRCYESTQIFLLTTDASPPSQLLWVLTSEQTDRDITVDESWTLSEKVNVWPSLLVFLFACRFFISWWMCCQRCLIYLQQMYTWPPCTHLKCPHFQNVYSWN